MLKDTIIVLITPFHAKQIKYIYQELNIDDTNLIIFYRSDFLKKELISIHKIKEATYVEMPSYKISYKAFWKNPIKKILQYRDLINSLKNFINQYIKTYKQTENAQIIIFADRDIFTQILIKEIDQFYKNCDIIAVEEGTGYYYKGGISKYIRKIAYRIFTPLLLGFRYRYINTFGTHPKIDTVYARLLNEIPYKGNRKYLQIVEKHEAYTYIPTTENNILILSCPLAIDGFMDELKEAKVVKSIFEIIKKAGTYHIFVKPHPRENIDRLKENLIGNDYVLIDKYIVSENIDYSKFDYIINFASSAIIDVVARGYPTDKIITIKAFPINFLNNLFNQTKIITLKELDNEYNFI